MNAYVDALRATATYVRAGRITRVSGLALEADGPDVHLGEVCRLESDDGRPAHRGEVVSVQEGRVLLMPYGATHGIGVGSRVVATGEVPHVAVGDPMLGRVVDAFGAPFDGGGAIDAGTRMPLHPRPINPLARAPIDTAMPTGVRVIDALLPLGCGQRVGIFAGSGVGKSSLMGMLARGVQADVNVVALIGERGREVQEFITHCLDDDARRRTVVLAATADQPAVVRARAAYAATAIAEHFRDRGARVFMMMDSVTRFAMARREIDLAAGQPPTARGYTPSVFTEIPALCERCGSLRGGGSITAVYTVLVEGDDHNEPIADALRATLDGHIVLTRELAHQGHFPAVDVLQSVSRLESQLLSGDDRRLQGRLRALLATHGRHAEMVDMGLYKGGANPALDEALQKMPALNEFLRQDLQSLSPRAETARRLAAALEDVRP
jgi:flagellum-specific ATP synthase